MDLHGLKSGRFQRHRPIGVAKRSRRRAATTGICTIPPPQRVYLGACNFWERAPSISVYAIRAPAPSPSRVRGLKSGRFQRHRPIGVAKRSRRRAGATGLGTVPPPRRAYVGACKCGHRAPSISSDTNEACACVPPGLAAALRSAVGIRNERRPVEITSEK